MLIRFIPSIDNVYLSVQLKIIPIIIHKKKETIYIGTAMAIFLSS